MGNGRTLTTERRLDLLLVLDNLRRELVSDMNDRIREVRSRGGDNRHVADEPHDESDIQDDIDLALIQMNADTLRRIELAIERLDQGRYGDCVACGGPISKERLNALPFAVRCKACEQRRENTAPRRARQTERHAPDNTRLDMAN